MEDILSIIDFGTIPKDPDFEPVVYNGQLTEMPASYPEWYLEHCCGYISEYLRACGFLTMPKIEEVFGLKTNWKYYRYGLTKTDSVGCHYIIYKDKSFEITFYLRPDIDLIIDKKEC